MNDKSLTLLKVLLIRAAQAEGATREQAASLADEAIRPHLYAPVTEERTLAMFDEVETAARSATQR